MEESGAERVDKLSLVNNLIQTVQDSVNFRQALSLYLKTKGLEVLSPDGYFEPIIDIDIKGFHLKQIDLNGRVKQGPFAFLFYNRGSGYRRAYHVELTCYKHHDGNRYDDCPSFFHHKTFGCTQCEAYKSMNPITGQSYIW